MPLPDGLPILRVSVRVSAPKLVFNEHWLGVRDWADQRVAVIREGVSGLATFSGMPTQSCGRNMANKGGAKNGGRFWLYQARLPGS